jgi:hypothetical protein
MTLDEAKAKFTSELPVWWWTVGECDLTCHASCGPDRSGIDSELLQERVFDNGFHADLGKPSTPEQALLDVLAQAKACKAAYHEGPEAFEALLGSGKLKAWGEYAPAERQEGAS